MKQTSIYLASRSLRRVELLSQLGLNCLVLPADIDESVREGEIPQDYVLRVAREKALACLQLLQTQGGTIQKPILAADTTVVLGDSIMGKPLSDADAFQMLKSMSGKMHTVHTAVAVVVADQIKSIISTTLVEMMPLTDDMIHQYIATGEHRDKAGAYGIQGLAGAWIKRIEGSYSGVMGLPVHESYLLLKDSGLSI